MFDRARLPTGLGAIVLAASAVCGLAPTGTLAATDYETVWAGVDHTCVIKPDGSADCWGENDHGHSADQLGPYVAVSAGGLHNCALTTSGDADCWGDNGYGEATDHAGPSTEVVAGWMHPCALTFGGAADCWGRNDSGQAVDQPGPYVEVSAGSYHTCGITDTGDIECWGNNDDGQLGRRLTISTPEHVPAGSRAEITGRLWSIDPACVASQEIRLRVLQPAGAPDRTTTMSATGRYAFERRVGHGTVLRVVYPGSGSCERIRSATRTIGAR